MKHKYQGAMKTFLAIFMLALGLGALESCHKSVKNNKTNILNMKDFGGYEAEWMAIDSLEMKGLYKSALERTEVLATVAKGEKNLEQSIKAAIFRAKYAVMLQEDGIVNAVSVLEGELKTTEEPYTSVVHSLLGEMYANYLQYNGYQVRNRTAISGGDESGDIRTWSAQRIEKEAFAHYKKSVEQPDNLAKVSLTNIKNIISNCDTTELRPTLLDFLGQRALQYFANESNYLTEPVNAYIMSGEEVFSPVDEFVKIRFESSDTTSRKHQALLCYQRILAAHLKDADRLPLTVTDLARFRFVHASSALDQADKDNLRVIALEALLRKNGATPAAYDEVAYALAEAFHGQRYAQENNTNPTDTTYLKTAVVYCEKALANGNDSYGDKQCRALLDRIKTPTIHVEAESYGLPKQPLLGKVTYSNAKKLYFRLVQLERGKEHEFHNGEEYWALHTKMNPIASWQYDVPGTEDYRTHSAEIKIPACEMGYYLVLASVDADFGYKSTGSMARVYVTEMNYWKMDYKGKSQYVLTDRRTGKALEGVQCNFIGRQYNSQSNKQDELPISEARTDKNGMVEIPNGSGREMFARFTNGADRIETQSYYQYGQFQEERQGYQMVQFFTDRAIYRPGQTIYFKGIAINKDGKDMPTILPKMPLTIVFRDANFQEKQRIEVVTNEFGSFHGSVIAPSSGLTGSMTLNSEPIGGSTNVQVEEYKRPKFEVKFTTPAQATKINEKVRVDGKAMAFAGSNIGGATVKYRVVRQTIYPYWYRGWGKGYFPQQNQAEIANGTTVTDDDGNFKVEFVAMPENPVDKKLKPQFNYTIYADVTDINGETRSAEAYCNVGVVSMLMDLELTETVELDSLGKIRLRVTDLNGNPLDAKGSISIQPLARPNKSFTEKYWQEPDRFVLTQSDYERDFPNYAWNGNDEPKNWAKKGQSHTFPFGTTKENMISLMGGIGIQAGEQYLITLETKDAFGESITLEKYIYVIDSKDKKTVFKNAAGLFFEKNTGQPGETTTLWVGTPMTNQPVYIFIERRSGVEKSQWIQVNGTQSFPITLNESDRGGIHAIMVHGYDNRSYRNEARCEVPWTNKDLKIEYSTFRDKLYPGQNETWRLKISGNDKDKVAAEMVATMYDASLDQFLPHQWYLGDLYPSFYTVFMTETAFTHNTSYGQDFNFHEYIADPEQRRVCMLNWFNFPFGGGGYRDRMMRNKAMKMEDSSVMMESPAPGNISEAVVTAYKAPLIEKDKTAKADMREGGAPPPPSPTSPKAATPPPANIRTNLKETVFFLPELRTDAEGNVVIEFKMNDALTRWKFLSLAHTKDLKYGLSQKEIVTQKELMILPNAPRFVREGDEVVFSSKVSNLSQATQTGTASLELFDAITMQPLEGDFGLTNAARSEAFTAEAGKSAVVNWRLKIPYGKASTLLYRITARSGNFSDGEENVMPIVTNRMLVTETMPLSVRGNQTKTFQLDQLRNNTSKTLTHHKYTLEFTNNPAWYAVQALPYLMEYPHDCSEQVFSRMYANTLAATVANRYPNIQRVFESWKGTDAMKSNLSKNQVLKTALLEETPWVLEAQSEEQQKQNIALLFDLNTMSNERTKAIATLAERQQQNGGWPWFPGGRPDWFITQYIATGFGHLQQLGAKLPDNDQVVANMTAKAVKFCDAEMLDEYNKMQKYLTQNKGKLDDDHLSYGATQWLYMRSFFKQAMSADVKKVHDYYLAQAEKYWLSRNLYQQGMLALALHRNQKTAPAQQIVASLRERAIKKEEMGMYWAFDWGYYWYQMPIETQALMVEVFNEVANDKASADELRLWLLKNKQTNNWKTTKATSEAVYALLLGGENWLNDTKKVAVSVGGKPIQVANYEPGTGYFKNTYTGSEIKSSWAEVKVENPNPTVAWGAVYWQYFEDLDQIKDFKKTPLTLTKTLFKEVMTNAGPQLTALNEGAALKVGDKIKVRIELRADRPMEYIHLKDMRASGMEPTNVLSGYRWQGGLGYYESTKDLATHFFIDQLPRGTFVFEYPLVVNNRGNFSNGITTIQSMYAPEFSSHSQGIRVSIDN